MKKSYRFWILAVGTILLDQITKLLSIQKQGIIIPNFLEIVLVKNTGMAMGMAEESTTLVMWIRIAVIIAMLVFRKVYKNLLDKLTDTLLIFTIASGISNLLDQIFRGYVVDFISLFPELDLPVFNLADICISLSCIGILVVTIKNKIVSKKQKR